MDRLFQWLWDRHGPNYAWALFVTCYLVPFPIYLFLAFAVVAFEHSGRYLAAAGGTSVAMAILAFGIVLPGIGPLRTVERWAAGERVDPATALEATYVYSRGAIARGVAACAICGAVSAILAGLIAGAEGLRLLQYAILGAAVGAGTHMGGMHSVPETHMRPPRTAIADQTGIGDSLPRTHPTFTSWLNVGVLGVVFAFSIAGGTLTGLFEQVSRTPVLLVVIGVALTILYGVPITVGSTFAPSLQPIRDLAAATKRVAAGNYTERLPVVQDDDLGALAASFNRMQAGLAERQRLQAAFGTYVDPALAARLLEQGDDVFTGERRQVTVMFIDIRDFTPFAEAHSAEDTVARLNALFEIVVPAVVDAGGHVNKFLGDGALAVFGAPNDLTGHADAAVRAALLIQSLVAERFAGALRIGIGINTGVVIAGTIGGGGKLEFTLIGDTVNVAARVEQLTKTTGDGILLTAQSVDALVARPAGLIDRGSHALKGKAAAVPIFALPND